VTRLRRVTELEIEPISVVSHELKTPLTSMRMAIHMLLDERVGSLNTKQAELLNAARDDSDRLNRIVENLLDIGRMESGQGQMELKPLSPEKLVQEAINEFQIAYRDAGVEIRSEVPADLPDVLADSARIPHVFSNLLSNALKYSPPGASSGFESKRMSQAWSFPCKTGDREFPSMTFRAFSSGSTA